MNKNHLTENEWIDENLKRLADNNGSRVKYINRVGSSATRNECESVCKKLNELNLANCNWAGGHLTEFGETVMAAGGWLKFKELELQQTLEEQTLSDKLRDLQIENLSLQNSQMRNKILFSIIGFVFGIIAANLLDILSLLKILPPE